MRVRCLVLLLGCLGLSGLLGSRSLLAQQSEGWAPAPAGGASWVHQPTGLVWPARLGGHQLKAQRHFAMGQGSLIRYEALDEGSRLDVHFLPAANLSLQSAADQSAALQKELQRVADDLLQMERDGRYKSVKIGPPIEGRIDLWRESALPLWARMDELTRPSRGGDGVQLVEMRQWSAVIAHGEWLITLRQVRPAGPAAETAMEELALLAFRVLKEPALQRGIRPVMEQWLQNPFAEGASEQLAAALAYLKGRSDLPITLPQSSLGVWVAQAAAEQGGHAERLVGAYLLGSGLALLEGRKADEASNEGARRVLGVAREIQTRSASLRFQGFEDFARAVAQSRGGQWLVGTHLKP